MEANTINPDQTAPKEAILSGPILLHFLAIKTSKERADDIIMNDSKKLTCRQICHFFCNSRHNIWASTRFWYLSLSINVYVTLNLKFQSREENAMVSLRRCTGTSEPSKLADGISTKFSHATCSSMLI